MKRHNRVFAGLFRHGKICPPHMGGGGANAGGQSVNGGLMKEDIDLTRGDLTLKGYIIN